MTSSPPGLTDFWNSLEKNRAVCALSGAGDTGWKEFSSCHLRVAFNQPSLGGLCQLALLNVG